MRNFLLLFVLFVIGCSSTSGVIDSPPVGVEGEVTPSEKKQDYTAPVFYRGMYLTNQTASDFDRLKVYVSLAKQSHINAFVIDAQTLGYKENVVPEESVKYCVDNDIYPIARVVVFPGGINTYPVNDAYVEKIIRIAEKACESGFREIQFDYIRFSDEGKYVKNLRNVSLSERYEYIEGFFAKARKDLEKYNVRIAADVFGRIPHNSSDRIGQRMENLDSVLDVICPMAYPSHYWTRDLQHDPYYTVKWTSSEAVRRTKKADIVTYIQAFQMKMPDDMSYEEYIRQQIKAIHDSKARGFIMWNARQEYYVPLKAVASYYDDNKSEL